MLMSRDAPFAPGRLHVVRAAGADCDSVAAAAHPRHAFLRSAWFSAAAPGDLTTLLAQRADGSPVAAVTLLRRRKGPISVREVAGCYWPYRSFPVAGDATDAEIAAFLGSRAARTALGQAWRMGPVFEDDPSARKLVRAASEAGWSVLRRRLGTCFEIDLKALTAEGPWPRASTLKKNRWREKKLAEAGSLSFRSFTGCDWTAADRDAIARIEAESWLATLDEGGATQFRAPGQRRLWERVADDPVLAPMLFGSLLFVGDAPAAFTFGLEVGGIRHHIANNFAERFAAHSPGKILLYRDFERAAARGVERISWGSGDKGYKSDMGARPGPAILDLLLVRPAMLARLLGRFWTDVESDPDASGR